MIIAEWKPIEEIIAMVEPYERLLLVGCATCVAECAAGGEREVQTLAPLLRLAFRQRQRTVTIKTRTLERQCEWEFVEELEGELEEVDAIISLACGIGVQALAERYAPLPVFPGNNTTSLAIREEQGIWSARCVACGDCVLGETFGLCPISRCAKSLLNGPCGGTRKDGMCEVNEDIPCVWRLIYERAKDCGQLDRLLQFRPPRSWANSRHGGPKRVVREDLRP